MTYHIFHFSFFPGAKAEGCDEAADFEKETVSAKSSLDHFSHKVSALRQRLELKAHTKKQIYDKYTSNQKPKLRSKPKLTIMADSSDGNVSKFKNIRMMFESK